MTYVLRGNVPVTAVLEHTRTVRGRRDPITGGYVTEQVGLGWFIHCQLAGGVYAFHAGDEKPPVKEGDTMEIILRKVGPL